jgi:anaphase-promoting complex subunit 3
MVLKYGGVKTASGRLTTFRFIDKHSETSRRHVPDAAAVYCLLGKLWHAYDDIKKAVDCYVEALKLNPFMWDAFLGLCNTG